MNAKSELVTVFKRKIEQLREEIKVLEVEGEIKDAKLKEEQEIREELDREVILLTRKVGVLENDLDDTEKRMSDSKQKWEEVNATAEECERARKQLQSRHESDDDRIYQLELLVKEATEQAAESETRYEEVARKLIAAENILESLEDEYEKTEKLSQKCPRELREVTAEFNIVCSSLKALEQNELKSTDKEKTYETECRKMKIQLQEAQRRAQMAETELTQRQMLLDELEDSFDAEKRNHMLLQSDMQRMVDEFQQM